MLRKCFIDKLLNLQGHCNYQIRFWTGKSMTKSFYFVLCFSY